MNFLRSGLFSDTDAVPAHSTGEVKEASDRVEEDEEPVASPWSFGFGSLVKTLASKSGEVLQAYQRDLHEFADGLKKETEVVAGVTVHAVKDLPHTLETGAVVAQESLETVGQTLEDFGGSIWRGTTDLIASVKEAVQKVDEEAAANSKAKGILGREATTTPTSSWKYSRYEAQVNAMQRDSSTYCDEPEDEEDFTAWRSTFNLSEKKVDIEAITKDNAFMQELQARIVPLIVEYDVFWSRYFYRLHKLQQAEEQRADLVKRATVLEEEELTWDVEEETDEVSSSAGVTDKPRSEVSGPTEQGVCNKGKEVDRRAVGGSSEISSPSVSGAKAGHTEITPEQSAGIPDEEAVSEGSTGSDWLVVQDEKEQGVSEDSSHHSSSVCTCRQVQQLSSSGFVIHLSESATRRVSCAVVPEPTQVEGTDGFSSHHCGFKDPIEDSASFKCNELGLHLPLFVACVFVLDGRGDSGSKTADEVCLLRQLNTFFVRKIR